MVLFPSVRLIPSLWGLSVPSTSISERMSCRRALQPSVYRMGFGAPSRIDGNGGFPYGS